jgi:hypothetical protein
VIFVYGTHVDGIEFLNTYFINYALHAADIHFFRPEYWYSPPLPFVQVFFHESKKLPITSSVGPWPGPGYRV